MPIGALALGIVIGLSILVPTAIDAIKTFVKGVAATLGNVSPDWGAAKTAVMDSFRSVDYSDLGQAGRRIFSADFLRGLLTSCLRAALDTDALATEFKTLLDAAIAEITKGVILFAAFSVLGAIVGFFVTRSELRRNVAKRKFGRAILIAVLSAILNVTIVAGGVYLIMKLQKFAVLCAVALFALYGAVSFLEAYLLHGYKKVSLKKVLRVRNFVSLAVVSVVQIVLSVLIAGLVFKIAGLFVGAFIDYSVLVLTLSCLSLNVEAYVKALASKEGEGGFDKEDFAKAMTELSAPSRAAASTAALAPAEGEIACVAATEDGGITVESSSNEEASTDGDEVAPVGPSHETPEIPPEEKP